MAKDAYYFPHDYNARNDVKCLFLRQQLGMEGYGIFWFLIESLADSGGKLPIKIVPVLAMQMQVPDVKVFSVINSFELFELDEEGFFSKRLNTHLELRKTLSEKGREGANLRWGNSPPTGLPSSKGNAKERKGKEIKEKKLIEEHFLTEEQKTGFKNFEKFISESASNVGKMKEPFTIQEYLKLKTKFSSDQIKELVLKMHNYKPLLQKNNSAYLTFLNWTMREKPHRTLHKKEFVQ